METGALILGIVLMCVGVGLVVFTAFWEVGRSGRAGLLRLFALVIAGFGLIMIGQWLIR